MNPVNLKEFADNLAEGEPIRFNMWHKRLEALGTRLMLDLDFLETDERNWYYCASSFKEFLEACVLPFLAARALGLSPPCFYDQDNLGDEREVPRKITGKGGRALAKDWEEGACARCGEFGFAHIEFTVTRLS